MAATFSYQSNEEANTDGAISLFADKSPVEEVVIDPYETSIDRFDAAFVGLVKVALSVNSVSKLKTAEELHFIAAFRKLIRLLNVLKTFSEFTFEDLPMTEQRFADYRSNTSPQVRACASQHAWRRRETGGSIPLDIGFECWLLDIEFIFTSGRSGSSCVEFPQKAACAACER